jgi:uncharacterized RDD family membrane protein YckC
LKRNSNIVSFRRRMAALLYDTIAVATVLYAVAFIPVLTVGAALNDGPSWFRLYLAAVTFGYFWVSWRRGRTLGMQAWKIEIVTGNAERPSLAACVLRFCAASVSAAALGLGYLAALVDPGGRTWHDRISGTQLVPSGSVGAIVEQQTQRK